MRFNCLRKKLCVTLMLLVVLLSASPFFATATASTDFSYTVEAKGQLVRVPGYKLRDTSDTYDAWKVRMTDSTEHTKEHTDGSAKTATLFWLGIYNKNGNNPMGSEKKKVVEGHDAYYFAAYAASNNKKVALYAADNSSTNKQYNIKGYWSPNQNHKPTDG
mgnify:FL=1